jgi:hypothetical protein
MADSKFGEIHCQLRPMQAVIGGLIFRLTKADFGEKNALIEMTSNRL